MKANSQKNNSKEIEAFKILISENTPPGDLTKNLIELFVNYSRRCIQHYKQGQDDGVCNSGDEDDQLFTLMQLIAVCDASSERPLFAEFVADHRNPKPSSDEPSSEAA